MPKPRTIILAALGASAFIAPAIVFSPNSRPTARDKIVKAVESDSRYALTVYDALRGYPTDAQPEGESAFNIKSYDLTFLQAATVKASKASSNSTKTELGSSETSPVAPTSDSTGGYQNNTFIVPAPSSGVLLEVTINADAPSMPPVEQSQESTSY